MVKIITPISTEPIKLTDVKLHLRIEATETTEDALIASLITTAREWCESYTGRALAPQTLEYYLNAFPVSREIILPKAPLTSVTSITYTDSAGVVYAMTENADYLVDTDGPMGRVLLPYNGSWPTDTLYPLNPIKIRYVSGYTTCPSAIKQAILLLIGHWYMNREAIGDVGAEVAMAVTSLLSIYRVRWWD